MKPCCCDVGPDSTAVALGGGGGGGGSWGSPSPCSLNMCLTAKMKSAYLESIAARALGMIMLS